MTAGIDIARGRIAEEAVAKTGWVDLGRLGLEHLPGELFALDHLRTLNLGRFYFSGDGDYHVAESDIAPNGLGDGLSRLSHLPHLQALHLNGVVPLSLAPLADLQHLQSLDCSDTQVSDLTPLQGLSSLQSLTCSDTQVRDLTPLQGLSSLQSLTCSSTQVNDLTPLQGLSSLQSLTCSFTQVNDLTPLQGLSSLQSLTCSSTQVSDLTPLADHARLRSLDIDDCTISDWSQELWRKTSLETVQAKGAALAGIPADILPTGWSANCLPAIRAHLDDLGDDPECLTDVKLIVLGNGRVGKTQIVNRLRDQPFEKDADSTHGVSLVQAPIPGASEDRFNIWDFGGQDIYFGTHMLFLKSRAVFMLVWTPTSDDAETHEHGGMTFRNQPVSWWLDCIRRFGNAGSPLIVVQNQLDRDGDRGDHPALADARDDWRFCRSVAHSALTDEGRGALDDHLGHAGKRFNPPLIGKGRLRVMRRLQAMLEEDRDRGPAEKRHRTLALDDFHKICRETGQIADPVQFLQFLHNAGLVFWRDGLFQNRVILDQAWVLDAVYTVFHREHCLKLIRARRGQFTRSDLGMMIWDRKGYGPQEQKLFLSFMRSSGICFVLREGSEDIETVYVAPDHLPEDWEPEVRRERFGPAAADAELTFAYPSLPPALMRNLIGRIGTEAGLSCDYWRNGFYGYESRSDARVLVEQRMDDRWQGTIRIQARGARSDQLVAEMEKLLLHEERRLGLRSDKRDPARRVKAPDRGEDAAERAPPRLDFAPEPREERRYYISYAWKDDRSEAAKTRAQIVDRFCARAKNQGITVQRDRDVMRLGDRISTFMNRLARGDRIVVILSDKYLRSPYCMYELYEIWLQARCEDERFLKRVRVYAHDDAKIWTITDRLDYAAYWDEECSRHVAAAKDRFHLLSPEDQQDISRMREFASNVAKILRVTTDTLQPRDLDDLVSYSFDDSDFDD